MKMFEFRLEFHWNLFLRVQLTIFQHWFRWWLGAVQATSHYLKQWWLIYRRIYASLGLNELSLIIKFSWRQLYRHVWHLGVVIAIDATSDDNHRYRQWRQKGIMTTLKFPRISLAVVHPVWRWSWQEASDCDASRDGTEWKLELSEWQCSDYRPRHLGFWRGVYSFVVKL